MGIPDVISGVLTTAEKLKTSSAGNEANTKALLIEPVLQALGWDLTDLDQVQREVKVFEGTFLDYALQGPRRRRTCTSRPRASARTSPTRSTSPRRSTTPTTTASSGAC